jgi:hypothetical protein
VGKQRRHHPDLSVDRRGQVLEIDDAALHLDDEQDPRDWMPGHDVDRSTVAEVVERVLDQRFSAHGPQHANARLDERRMRAVDEAIQVAAAPARIEC